MVEFNFEVNFTEPTDIEGKLVTSTHIVDVPGILKNILNEDRTYFVDNLSTNMTNFKAALDEYLEEYAAQNNADLEAKILDEVIVKNDKNTYDINVTHSDTANNANNADRLENNSLEDIYNHVETVQFPEANVKNSEHLSNKTLEEILDMVPDIEVKQANNTNTLQGFSKDDLVTEIKAEIIESDTNDASTLQGESLEDIIDYIHNKVENDTTDWHAWDALNFDGKTPDEWVDIIANTKSNTAGDSDTVNGKSYADIEEARDTAIKTATDNYLTDYDEDVTKKIVKTQVDMASDTVLFNGDDRETWITTITETKVNMAADSEMFVGKTQDDWENRINDLITHNDDLVDIIKNKTEDEWKANDAKHADTADEVDSLSNDLKSDIIDEAVTAVGNQERYIDALLLEGKTADDIIDAANEKSTSGTVSLGAKFLGRAISPEPDTDLMDSIDTVIEASKEIINGLIFNMNEFIAGSFDEIDEDKSFAVVFEPENLDIWTRIETEYNSNGSPLSKKFFFAKDENLNINKGVQLHDPFYDITADADHDTEFVNYYFNAEGLMTIIGTGTNGDEVTIHWREGDDTSGTVEDDYFKIQSSSSQERYLLKEDLTFNKTELAIIEVKYFYTDGILDKKEYYDYANNLYLTKTFNNEFSSTPTTSEIILDIRCFDETLVAGETSVINTLIIEGTPVKEEIKTIITELSPNNNSLVKDEFVFDADLIQVRREVTWPANIDVGETVNISYVLKNVAGKDLKDITLSESNSGISISGSVSSLADGAISSGDITASYDLTSTDIDNGRISASSISYDCKDSDDNSYSQPAAETLRPTTEFRVQIIRNRYSAADSSTSIEFN